MINSIINSLGDMGLFLDGVNGIDFHNGGDIEDGGEANITATVFGILFGGVTVMFVFLVIAYIIRVKQ